MSTTTSRLVTSLRSLSLVTHKANMITPEIHWQQTGSLWASALKLRKPLSSLTRWNRLLFVIHFRSSKKERKSRVRIPFGYVWNQTFKLALMGGGGFVALGLMNRRDMMYWRPMYPVARRIVAQISRLWVGIRYFERVILSGWFSLRLYRISCKQKPTRTRLWSESLSLIQEPPMNLPLSPFCCLSRHLAVRDVRHLW